ncbi:hypothetical protein PHLCEN_2v10057 [Hermanssonia centrifuga]|uniref:Secreted protein n=1 Tax=Hermanssonia centrifuga TaxID=98765 RepID=A0A2R6NNS3_9APHY|nr:hypothetical protein PHLCEN_2v10057 [Hermanssonia centrifuga]
MFAPVHCISFLLASASEQTQVVIRQTAEHEKETRENTVFDRHGYVNRRGDFTRRHKTVRDIFVSCERGDVVARRKKRQPEQEE